MKSWPRSLVAAFLVATVGGVPLLGEEATLVFSSPEPGVPATGPTEFVLEVMPPESAGAVELWIDDELVADWESPPYRTVVDLGLSNAEHRFEAVALDEEDRVIAEALMVSPAIRVDQEIEVELQQLYVTVTEQNRRSLDLTREDFVVLDDGQRQEILTFARGDVRLTAAILIDASASMRGERLRFALGGAEAFVAGMTPQDQAAIHLFSDRLLHRTPFLSDAPRLLRGLDRVRPDGGTALNDHLYLALKLLEREQGRRVVILLTDGFDSHSSLRMREVRWLARRSRALLYWLRTDTAETEAARWSAWKNPVDYREEHDLLTRTVLESGGRILTLERLAETEAAILEVLAELREQYVLGYLPSHAGPGMGSHVRPRGPRNDGRWHEVAVRVRRSGARVRAADGYVDF